MSLRSPKRAKLARRQHFRKYKRPNDQVEAFRDLRIEQIRFGERLRVEKPIDFNSTRMRIRVLIVDDEALARARVRKSLED